MPFAEDLLSIRDKINALPIILEDDQSPPSNYQQIQELAVRKELSSQADELKKIFMEDSLDEDAVKERFIALCQQRDQNNQNSCLGFNAIPDSVCNTLYWEIAQILFAPKNLADMLAILMPSIKEQIYVDLSLYKKENQNQRLNIDLVRVNLMVSPLAAFTHLPPSRTELYHIAFGNHALFDMREIIKFPFNLHQQLYPLLDKYPYLKHVIYSFNPEFLQLSGLIEIAANSSLKQRIATVIPIFIHSGSSYTGEFYAKAEAGVAAEQFIDYIGLFSQADQAEICAMRANDNSCSMQDIIKHLKKLDCVEMAADHLKKILDNPINKATLEKVLNFNTKDFKSKTNFYRKTALESIGHDDTKIIPRSIREATLSHVPIPTVQTLLELLLSLPAEEFEFLLENASIKEGLTHSKLLADNLVTLGPEKAKAYLLAFTKLHTKFGLYIWDLFDFLKKADRLDLYKTYLQSLSEQERITKIDEVVVFILAIESVDMPSLVEFSEDINRVYSNNKTLLGMMFEVGDITVIRSLIAQGPNLNISSNNRMPIELAIEQFFISMGLGDERISLIEYMINKGADLKLINHTKFLDYASSHSDAFNTLLERLANRRVEFGDFPEETLIKLVESNKIKTVRTLLGLTKDPTQFGRKRNFINALFNNINDNTIPILKLIKADLPEIAKSVTLYKMNINRPKFIEDLSEYLPDVDHRLDNGLTLFAMMMRQLIISRSRFDSSFLVLLRSNANANQAIDEQGRRPIALLMALPNVLIDRYREVSYLIEYGAVLDSTDDLSKILACIIKAGNQVALAKFVAMTKERPINPNNYFGNRQTLLGLTMQTTYSEIIQSLFDGSLPFTTKLDVNQRFELNGNLVSPLEAALDIYIQDDSKSEKIVKILLEKGADTRTVDQKILLMFAIDNPTLGDLKQLLVNFTSYDKLPSQYILKLWKIIAHDKSYPQLPAQFYERLTQNNLLNHFSKWYQSDTVSKAKDDLLKHISNLSDAKVNDFIQRNRSFFDESFCSIIITNISRLRLLNGLDPDTSLLVENLKKVVKVLPGFVRNAKDFENLLELYDPPHKDIRKLLLNILIDFQFTNLTPEQACATYLSYLHRVDRNMDVAQLSTAVDLVLHKIDAHSRTTHQDFNQLFLSVIEQIEEPSMKYDLFILFLSDINKYMSELKILFQHLTKDMIPSHGESKFKTVFDKCSSLCKITHPNGFNLSDPELSGNIQSFLKRFETAYESVRKSESLSFFRRDFIDELKKADDPIKKIDLLLSNVINNPQSRSAAVWKQMASGERERPSLLSKP